MISPSIPNNENQRIEQLKSYSILDTLPEEDYDNLTTIAAGICNTPISMISFVDEKRQWFKSTQGIEAVETDRKYSFCGHAINDKDKLFVVNDAKMDDRFQDNPLVTGDLNIGFYAGAPLVDDEGFVLGTLCVIDNKPKKLTDKQKHSLKCLAKQVVSLLELRRKRYELEKALKDLKFKNKELEEFTYITSHDLQEPVRTIVSLIEMLSSSHSKEFDANGLEMMKYITEAGNRMKALILGLLDYSRLGTQKVLTRVDCNSLVTQVQNDLAKSIYETNAVITAEKLPIVKGYETELRLLMQNIISNAIKFRKKNENPLIEISCIDEKKHWKFSFSDNGIGIQKEHRVKIFQIFQRLHARDEYGGHGLGLTHCRKIIELHHGKIWVVSEPNIGSTFFFTIPKKL